MRAAASVRPQTRAVRVRSVSRTPSPDWDALTVVPPGGHVLQSTGWAAHRAQQGWRPWFVHFSDGRAALFLTLRQPPLPGFLAYAPRGPISAGDPPVAVAARAIALATFIRSRGGTVLVVDPELAAGGGYEEAMARGGFRPTEEIQASRHRVIVRFPAGATEAELLKAIDKNTRQRIRAAARVGTHVLEDPEGRHLDGLANLLARTAERKDFYIGDMGATARWWGTALRAGHARLWVALNGDRLLGGLLAYVQGGHIATAYSADEAGARERYPGTMHVLRWTAMREALAAGAPELDLGGVDAPGTRGRPRPGEPLFGLLEHKRSFGAEWVESTPAHEIVLRPWLHGASELGRSVYRLVRRRGVPTGAGKGTSGAMEGQ